MKTAFITFLSLFCLATSTIQAQPNRPSANIGFIYPLSSNGAYAVGATNHFSANVIAGVSKNETSFCVAGIANYISDTGSGAIIAGIINITGKYATGLQAAGMMNLSPKASDGLMAAGMMNIAGKHKGLMAAGFGNIATTEVEGMQAAGFINIAPYATVQAAGFVNIAKGRDTNLNIGFARSTKKAKTQIAGYLNIADEVDGIQIAGLMNIAKKVRGVQLAGLINIADSSDCPIGFVNIIKLGEKSIGLNFEETGTNLVAFRSGGKKLYGIVGIGANFRPYNALFATQFGLGANMHVTRYFRFKTEATVTTLKGVEGILYVNSSIRFMPAVKIGRVEAFAGPGLSSIYNNRGAGYDLANGGFLSISSRNYAHTLYIGFMAGIQVHL